MSNPTITQSLAEFVCGLRVENLPTEVTADARWRLLDTVGVAIAGSRMDFAALVAKVVKDLGGKPEATLLGMGDRLPAPLAGLVNGTLAHGPDYDDTHSTATLHPSCVAVPAALAMSERVGATGGQCLLATVVAAEIQLRLASAVPPFYFPNRGLHGNGLFGPIGAAAAAALLLELDETRTTNALGLAGASGAGLMQGHLDGSWTKRLYPGRAIELGLMSALLAEQGFTGPAELLEGDYGLYRVLSSGDEENLHLESVVSGLGERWLYPETIYKVYPSGSVTHSPMDGLAKVMRDEAVQHEEIERIDCYMPPDSILTVCEPRDVRLNPKTPYHLKFSLPYCMAILAVNAAENGSSMLSIDDFGQSALDDQRIKRLAARVHGHSDPQMNIEGFPARVVVSTRGGRQYEEVVNAQRGTIANPMTPTEHRAKFRANVQPSLGEDRAEELSALLEGLWEASGLDPLADAVRGMA